MKYIVVKGWLGFGDRLEDLKMAVWYALKNNIKIYVDWKDSMWSHGTEDFYTYFKLINIPILESLDDIPEGSSFYPSYWNKETVKTPFGTDMFAKIAEHKLDIGILDKEFPADVIVLCNVGRRMLYPDSAFFANCFRVIDNRVIAKINERKSRYPIGQSWGIHIRGTDRLTNRTRVYSIQALVSLIATYGGLNGVKMTVVGDDKTNIELWKRFFPDSFILSELSLQQKNTLGNHNLDQSTLTVSKDSLNVDMLSDFFTLASTSRIFSTSKDSRYAQEARRLQPFVSKILGQ